MGIRMDAGRFVRAIDGFLRIGFNLPTTEEEQTSTEPDDASVSSAS